MGRPDLRVSLPRFRAGRADTPRSTNMQGRNVYTAQNSVGFYLSADSSHQRIPHRFLIYDEAKATLQEAINGYTLSGDVVLAVRYEEINDPKIRHRYVFPYYPVYEGNDAVVVFNIVYKGGAPFFTRSLKQPIVIAPIEVKSARTKVIFIPSPATPATPRRESVPPLSGNMLQYRIRKPITRAPDSPRPEPRQPHTSNDSNLKRPIVKITKRKPWYRYGWGVIKILALSVATIILARIGVRIAPFKPTKPSGFGAVQTDKRVRDKNPELCNRGPQIY